jgi:hypothetical protein
MIFSYIWFGLFVGWCVYMILWGHSKYTGEPRGLLNRKKDKTK